MAQAVVFEGRRADILPWGKFVRFSVAISQVFVYGGLLESNDKNAGDTSQNFKRTIKSLPLFEIALVLVRLDLCPNRFNAFAHLFA